MENILKYFQGQQENQMDNKIQYDFEAKYFKIEDISVDP